MSPIGLSSRRLLSQSTHVSVANSTSSRPRRPIVGDRRLPLLAPNGALQAHLAHQPLDGAAGCSDPLAMQLLPGLQATIYKGIFVMLRHLKGARVRKRRIIGAKRIGSFGVGRRRGLWKNERRLAAWGERLCGWKTLYPGYTDGMRLVKYIVLDRGPEGVKRPKQPHETTRVTRPECTATSWPASTSRTPGVPVLAFDHLGIERA
jgi:hypothetical protein